MLKICPDENILYFELARPEVKNAFNPEMIAQITEGFLKIPAGTRAVVLSGEGDVFCSGADLQWMKSMVNFDLAENQKDSEQLYAMFAAIANCPVPVISLVQGAAFGGALGLIATSDVVIADPSAQFCFSEVKLGIVPAVISSFILNKVSFGSVAPYMISGKMFKAAEAQQWGIVHQVVDKSEFKKALEPWLKAIREAGPEAVKTAKKMLQNLRSLQTEESIKKLTTETIAERRVSAEGQEGLRSFLEKRSPSWRIGK